MGRDAPGQPLAIEVTYRPGVTDSAGDSIVQAARVLGLGDRVQAASTGRRYLLHGQVCEADAHRLALGLLCNDLIQSYSLGHVHPALGALAQEASDRVEQVPLIEADDAQLEAISRRRLLSLNLDEMRAVRAYFRSEGREPNEVEIETIAQTWSEHCGHKTFRGIVEYEERVDGEVRRERIDGLLRTYLRRATEEIAKPWVRSAFVDNAGILDFEDGWEISFKVETHNHPSALEPFGGANTGVGGVIRDIIGVSHRPIANTDVLCFGPQERAFDDLPAGILHPRRVFEGVVAGVEDYGNKMGIPTVGGAILFDPGYEANPLVYCGCLGLAPTDLHRSNPLAGDRLVLVGGRTGRDGLRGATFSSAELTHLTAEQSGSAVQIGNPIVEKKAMEAILIARDEQLYHAITDCGGGGLSSAVGEMGREVGVSVQLDRIPLKYAGLKPWEIWLSEAQERMILAVPAENVNRVTEICAGLDVEATDIGQLTGDRRLTLQFGDAVVAAMDMEFLHNGIPRRHLRGVWEPRPQPAAVGHSRERDLNQALLDILGHPNVASKEAVIRLYDHEVQGATVVKPLAGARNHGPSDAAVLKPAGVPGWKGIALSHGVNPRYSLLDPYLMARAVIDEAVRNAVCVGADPDRLAILDNFCWGNPDLPDRMGDLVRACKGCYRGAKAFGAPFISGKDSLNNEYTDIRSGLKHSIPPTLLISAVGIVPDVRMAVTMDLKSPGDYLYAVGETREELGGSYYAEWASESGSPPSPVENGLGTARKLHGAISGGLVRACHDCSEGGVAVAAAEMAMAGDLGLDCRLADLPQAGGITSDAALLFSESNSRYLVEVAPGLAAAFESALTGVSLARFATVVQEPMLTIGGLDGASAIRLPLIAVERAWRGAAGGAR